MDELAMKMFQQQSGERMKTWEDDLVLYIVGSVSQLQPATNTDHSLGI